MLSLRSRSQAHTTKTKGIIGSQSRELCLLEDVNVTFGNIKALQNIQLTIEKGEIVFLTGPSGAGKTSLLKVISGDISPHKGRIHYNELFKDPDFFMTSVFQDLRLFQNQTLEQNLMASFDSRLYGSKNDFFIDLIEIAKILGVRDRLHLKVHEANGGLKQKIAFLRAILARPDVVLADEPTASLDYENAKKMYDVLNLYNAKRGMTVIWASHNKDLVRRFSGRIIHLDKGRIIYSGHACFI